jgi:hypothetical protein
MQLMLLNLFIQNKNKIIAKLLETWQIKPEFNNNLILGNHEKHNAKSKCKTSEQQ